ncbi:MAG: hypothetical protein N3D74_03210 [Caldisericia bacterium]|nr:hypothetical protein [Caldisericia bacterium]
MEELIPLIEFYRKKVERNPQLLSSHAVLSEYLILNGNYDEATLISLKSLLVLPSFIRSQIDLSISYLMKNDFKSSEIELKQALKIDPENDCVYFLLGLIYYILGVNDIAIKYLKEGFDYNPKNVFIRKLYSLITNEELPDISKFKDTETKVYNGFISSNEMKKIKEENGNKKPYEVLYAYTLRNEDRLMEAIEELERILIYHPYYPKALFILGKFQEMAGNRRKKDEYWEKCYEVDPLKDFIKAFSQGYENYHFDKRDFEELVSLKDKLYEKIYKTFVKEKEYIIEKIEEKKIEIPQIEVEEIKEEELEEIKEETKISEEELIKEEIVEKEEVKLQTKQEVEEIKDKEYYKKLGDEYLKKGMYKEAIEMFTKALNLSKERK